MSDLISNRTREAAFGFASSIPVAQRAPVSIWESIDTSSEAVRKLQWFKGDVNVQAKYVGNLLDQFEKVTGKPFPQNELPKTDFNDPNDPLKSTTDKIVEYINKFVEENPEYQGQFNTDIDNQVTKELRDVFDRKAMMDAHSGTGAAIAGMASGFITGMGDPAMVATTVLMAPFGAGMGLGKTLLTESAANMAIEVLVQPSIAERMERIGEEHTFADAAADVLVAGVAGPTLYLGMRGLSSGIGKLRDMKNGLNAEGRALLNWLERSEVEAKSTFVKQTQGAFPTHEVKEFYNNIDITTKALIRGSALPQIEVNVHRIDVHHVMSDIEGKATAFAENFDDPLLREDFIAAALEANSRIRDQTLAIQDDAMNVARSEFYGYGGEAEPTPLPKRQPRGNDAQGFVTEDYVYGDFYLHKSEDGKGIEVRPIDNEELSLGTFKTLKAAEEHINGLRKMEHQANVDEFLARQPKYIQAQKDAENALAEKTYEQAQAFSGTGKLPDDKVPVAPEDFYAITPYRAQVMDMAERATMSVEQLVKYADDVDTSRLSNFRSTVEEAMFGVRGLKRPDAPTSSRTTEATAPKAEPLPPEQVAAAVARSKTILAREVAVSDELGKTSYRTVGDVLKEIDEDLNFIEEFKVCRI